MYLNKIENYKYKYDKKQLYALLDCLVFRLRWVICHDMSAFNHYVFHTKDVKRSQNPFLVSEKN